MKIDEIKQQNKRFFELLQYSNAIMFMFDHIQQKTNLNYFENDLIYAMNEFTLQLKQNKQYNNIEWLWKKCIELIDNKSYLLLYSYSRTLLSLNKIFEAIYYMEKTLEINPNFILARESIDNMKSLIVDQWHFRMLNDKERNLAYNKAIQNAILKIPNAIVLDIGGGTGLLSMYAIRAGASHVYCCEVSTYMAELARKCIKLNGYEDKITVIEAHSTDLYITSELKSKKHNVSKKFGLPQRVSIIVTELVDSGLLGEHIIPVLKDAANRLLIHEGGIIIPHGAELFGVPIMSTDISNRHTLQSPLQTELDSEYYWSNISYNQMNPSLNSLSNINRLLNIPLPVLCLDETYTCESYQMLLENDRIKPISNIISLGYLSFYPVTFKSSLESSLESLESIIQSNINLPYTYLYPIELIQSGHIDGFAMWFTLHLESSSSFSSTLSSTLSLQPSMIQTLPERMECGWDQAILFPSQQHLKPFHSLNQREYFQSNQMINLHLTIQESSFEFQFNLIDNKMNNNNNNNNSIKVNQLMNEQLLNIEYPINLHTIGEMDMAELNNHSIFEKYFCNFHELYKSLLINQTLVKPIRIIEMCNNWRSYSLTHYLYQQSLNISSTNYENFILCSSEPQYQYLSNLLFFYQQNYTSLEQNSTQNLPRLLFGSLIDIYPEFQSNFQSKNHFNLIICDLIEGSGLIKQNIFTDIAFIYHFESMKHDEVIFLPHSISVQVALLEYTTLWNHSRVNDINTVEIELSSITNCYGVNMIRELDLHDTKFPSNNFYSINSTKRFLSSSQTGIHFTIQDIINDSPEEFHPIIKTIQIQVEESGILHCIALWYHIHLNQTENINDTINTGPISSNNNINNSHNNDNNNSNTYWRQIGFLVDNPKVVEKDEVISINIIVDRISGIWCKIIN